VAVMTMRHFGIGGIFGTESTASTVSTPVSSTVASTMESKPVSSEETSGSGLLIETPSLLNENFDEWIAKTEDGSLNFSIRLTEREYHDTVPEGCIVSQSPEAGTEITAGSTVTVVVSRGPRMRALPYIANLTLAEASEALSEAGFNTKKEDVFDDTVPYGEVVGYKSYSAGDECEAGSTVVILLSKGPDRNNSTLGTP